MASKPRAQQHRQPARARQDKQEQAQGQEARAQQDQERAADPNTRQEREGDVPARFQPPGTGQAMSYEDAPKDQKGAQEFADQQASQPQRLGPRPTTDLTAPAGFSASIPANAEGRFEYDPDAPDANVPDMEGIDREAVKEVAKGILTSNMDVDPGTAYRRAIAIVKAEQAFDEDKLFQEVTPPTLGPRGHAGVGAPPPQEALKQAHDVTRQQVYKALENQRNPDANLKVNTPGQRIPAEPIPTDFRDIQEEEGRRSGRASVTV